MFVFVEGGAEIQKTNYAYLLMSFKAGFISLFLDTKSIPAVNYLDFQTSLSTLGKKKKRS